TGDDEQRLGKADNPGNRSQQGEAGQQRHCQSDPPGPALLLPRQPPREDRDEDEIVDTEHKLEGGQRQKGRPDFPHEYPSHSDPLFCPPSERKPFARVQDCAIWRRASTAARSSSLRSSASRKATRFFSRSTRTLSITSSSPGVWKSAATTSLA